MTLCEGPQRGIRRQRLFLLLSGCLMDLYRFNSPSVYAQSRSSGLQELLLPSLSRVLLRPPHLLPPESLSSSLLLSFPQRSTPVISDSSQSSHQRSPLFLLLLLLFLSLLQSLRRCWFLLHRSRLTDCPSPSLPHLPSILRDRKCAASRYGEFISSRGTRSETRNLGKLNFTI